MLLWAMRKACSVNVGERRMNFWHKQLYTPRIYGFSSFFFFFRSHNVVNGYRNVERYVLVMATKIKLCFRAPIMCNSVLALCDVNCYSLGACCIRCTLMMFKLQTSSLFLHFLLLGLAYKLCNKINRERKSSCTVNDRCRH